MKFEFSAGGIVYCQKGKDYYFALILDSYGQWTFPKGKIEKGEKPEIAALREVEEETGLSNLRVVKLVKKIDYWFKKPDLVHKFVYFYLMEASSNTELSHQKEEVKDAQWFRPNQAIKIIGYKKDDLPLLKEALAILKHPNF